MGTPTVAERLTRVELALQIAAVMTHTLERMDCEYLSDDIAIHKVDIVKAAARALADAHEELFWVRKNTRRAALAAQAPDDDQLEALQAGAGKA